MQLPKEIVTVTKLSKMVALIMFITLPIIAFLFGMRYQTALTELNTIPPLSIGPTTAPVSCTLDAKICPDGTAVGRVAPNCEFEKCPTTASNGRKFTGQITSISYECHMDGICSIGVGKGSIILEKGEGPPGESRERGTFPEGLLNEDKKSFYIGKSVEVFAESPDGRTDSYTLFGSTDYYVKLLDTSTTIQTMCGGIAGKICPNGYYCKYNGTYPDASGTCLKETIPTKYKCPTVEYVDCMPGPGTVKSECSTAFLQWAQTNCPNFKGAAY